MSWMGRQWRYEDILGYFRCSVDLVQPLVVGRYKERFDTCCSLHNPVAWLLDSEPRVERCLGVSPLHSCFAAVPRSCGIV